MEMPDHEADATEGTPIGGPVPAGIPSTTGDAPPAADSRPKSEPSTGFRALVFVLVFAVDVALIIVLFSSLAEEKWVKTVLIVAPMLTGAALVQLKEQLRAYLFAKAKQLPFDIGVSVCCALLLYAHYWLPSGKMVIPVLMDDLPRRPILQVDSADGDVSRADSSRYSALARIPFSGAGKRKFTVTTLAYDSLRDAYSESIDVYEVGFFERLRAWKVLRDSPLEYVLEFPSTLPVTLQFDTARLADLQVHVEGRFPRRFLQVTDQRSDPEVTRFGATRKAGDGGVFSTDSARLSFSVAADMSSQTLRLPRGAFEMRVEEAGCTRTARLRVNQTVTRIPVDEIQCRR